MIEDRSIGDLLGEALRRHRHGLIRPLWADMPEGELKQRWRNAGAGLLMADDQRHSAEGLLREAAMKTLSVRTAIEVLRKGWLASAEYAALFATDDPQTPEQWRAFGGVEAQRACAGELDPDKDAIFEPSELAKARAEAERLTRQIATLAATLRPFSAAVFNDNGDVTISTGHLRTDDWLKARAAIAQLDAPLSHRVRHKRRGSTYVVIGDDFRLQSSRPIEEGETIVVYRGDDGKGWARPLDEFTDGRFEPVERQP